MKLLFDENVSAKLAALLAEEYSGSIHVRDIGLLGASDGRIWEYARENGFVIVRQFLPPDELAELLDSLCMQHSRPFDVLVVDDGSDPPCEAAARAFAERLDLAYVYQENAGPGAARAQDYPNRPVTIVVPFAPGASTDTLARIFATRLQAKLGQTVQVENRGGGGGLVGGRERAHLAVRRLPPVAAAPRALSADARGRALAR